MTLRSIASVILRFPRSVLDWACAGRPDYQEFAQRRQTGRYRARRRWCKNIWIVSGLLMLLYPHLAFVLACAMATAWLCFAILDESEENDH